MNDFIHAMGAKAKCKITGYEGIIVARADHITGCNTYGLKPKMDKEGKVRNAEWFDEGVLEVKGKGIKIEDVAAPTKGGPLAENPPG